jgi:hypothetical protein
MIERTFEHLLRKTIDEAEAELIISPVKYGISTVTRVRAVVVDGHQMMVTADIRTDRLNVTVENNIITGFTKVG